MVRMDDGAASLAETFILLWAPARPSLLHEPWLRTLNASGNVHVLLHARSPDGLAAGQAAHLAGLPVQAILSLNLPCPAWANRCVSLNDADEANALALALCDGVLVEPDAPHLTAVRPVLPLDQPAVLPAASHPCLPRPVGRERPGGLAGWIDHVLSNTFAFQLRPDPSGRPSYARAWKRMRNGPARKAYFAPDWDPKRSWKALCPDQSQAKGNQVVSAFEEWDVEATRGAGVHRDIIWLGHLMAAGAVLAAVAGTVARQDLGLDQAFAVIELLLLASIGGMTTWVIWSHAQGRWMAARFAAEQLRMARLCLPLLVVPPVFQRTANALHGDVGGKSLVDQAIRAVQRVVRDEGLPQLDSRLTATQATAWLRLIVRDQFNYHEANTKTLEVIEERLHGLAAATFFLAIGAVLVHLLEEVVSPVVLCSGFGVVAALLILWRHRARLLERPALRLTGVLVRLGLVGLGAGLLAGLAHGHALLLVTAAGPALAAALHGIGVRLGLANRAAESHDVLNQLGPLLEALEDDAKELGEVRDLARQAAGAMTEENQRWHGLLRRQRDILP